MLTTLSTRLRKANTKNFLNFRKSKNMSDRFWEHWRGTVTANPSICRVYWQTWQRFINVLSWLLFDGPVYFTVAGFFFGCYKLPAFPEPVYPNSGKEKRRQAFPGAWANLHISISRAYRWPRRHSGTAGQSKTSESSVHRRHQLVQKPWAQSDLVFILCLLTFFVCVCPIFCLAILLL